MTSWALIAAVLAAWFALSVPIGLIVGRIARFGTQADAHLECHPHSTGPGTPKPGPVHPLDADWRWPPAVDYHRERRQG